MDDFQEKVLSAMSEKSAAKLQNGNPKKYFRRHWTGTFFKNTGIFLGFGIVAFYVLVIRMENGISLHTMQRWGMIVTIVLSIVALIFGLYLHIICTDKTEKSYPADKSSFAYGIECKADTKKYLIVPLIYTIICFVLLLADFIYTICINKNLSTFAPKTAYIIGMLIPCSIMIGLWASLLYLSFILRRSFPLSEHTCPQCHYVNTVIPNGQSNFSTRHDVKKLTASTTSGEHRTHTVYVDGKEVGGVYASHSGYDYYDIGDETTWNNDFICTHCGNKTHTSDYSFKKKSETWERNSR